MNLNLPEMVAWFIVFIFSTTCHEAAHALVAWRGGDSTAYEGGQVSLDPIPHIRREPIGMLIVPIMTYLSGNGMLGWASAPYDAAWGRRFPLRQAFMSLAGPSANLLLALLAFTALKILMFTGVMVPPEQLSMSRMVDVAQGTAASPMGALAMTLSILLTLNVLLGFFNLLPVPPLDGSGVLAGLFPKRVQHWMDRMQSQPAAGIVGLLVAWQVFNLISEPLLLVVRLLLHPGIRYS